VFEFASTRRDFSKLLTTVPGPPRPRELEAFGRAAVKTFRAWTAVKSLWLGFRDLPLAGFEGSAAAVAGF
jgi:hypothetical protein